MARRCVNAVVAVIVGAALVWGLYLWQPVRTASVASSQSVPPFQHVFVIMMENRGQDLIGSPNAPYLTGLSRTYGYETDYFGVTHPSLPNYAALISGRTGGSHSDNPTQTFAFPSLVTELNAHHISFQAVMQSIPRAGYLGNWYPSGPPGQNPVTMPTHALYAKKHDPFLLFDDGIAARQKVVPLHTLASELTSGRVPRFVWITPNLCNDMHGQPDVKGARCPEQDASLLIRQGDRFAATWVPKIMQSSAWTGNSVIFIVWDETDWPGGWPTAGKVRQYFAPGPAAPALVPAIPALGAYGGGKTPLIVIARQGPHPMRLNLWADHYSLLRTIEDSWHLPPLGHAAQVSPLASFFQSPKT